LPVEEIHQSDIAIIGISARFSDSDNKDAFWDNLVAGRDCIKSFPKNCIADMEPFCEYLKNYIKHFDFSDPESYSKGGYLDNIDGFDYSYFRISPNDAVLMDPCQRLFLQGCVEAIHDAGYNDRHLGYRSPSHAETRQD
jgi:acyl transferase domain-containing protein